MIKELRQKSFELYKKNPGGNFLLGLICGLLCAAFLSIGLLNSSLVILIVPFIILPIIFACYCAYLQIQANASITGKEFLSNFGNYYRSSFISSFSVIKSFLIAFLADFVGVLIFFGIAYGCIKATNGERLNDFLSNLDAILRTQYTYDMLKALLNEYKDIILPFEEILIFPTSFITFATFIYFTSKSSLSVYYRLSVPSINGMVANLVQRKVFKLYRKDILKAYWGLNWPLFVLLALGYSAGLGVAFLANTTIEQATSLGFVFAFVFAGFFLPFYFSNMQVIYEAHVNEYRNGTMEVTKDMINRFSQNINLSQMQKDNFEKMMKDLDKDNVVDEQNPDKNDDSDSNNN